jgi:phosphoribosylamine--glycine ligase
VRILVIGSGGREHALCWKLAQSPEVERLYAAPGNPGIAQIATCIDHVDFVDAAESMKVDLTVVGPEAPLAAGVVDRFQQRGLAIVGPTAAAAQLESSKTFAKDFMVRAGIPTARFTTVDSIATANAAIGYFGLPLVLKADGLAAGKGVVIAHSRQEAEAAAAQLLTAGSRLVVEEFLTGEECSFIVLSDGKSILELEPTQDHKAVFDGDQGPNTGGMGAYCDGRILSDGEKREVMDTVIRPAVAGMNRDGHPFTGFLYAGLMMTALGPKVLEFNARLGDPETQVLMHRMKSDFVPFLRAAAHGELGRDKLEWKPETSVCVVLAAAGYPDQPRSGDAIEGIEEVTAATVFHAGTKLLGNVLATSGGRVLGVTASGPDLRSAITNTYAEVGKIHFNGMHYRRDIGQKGLKRW